MKGKKEQKRRMKGKKEHTKNIEEKGGMESSGQWLEKTLMELCNNIESSLDLDAEIVSELVSYCELAPPLYAKEYLDNIIGPEAGKSVTDEYMRRRGHSVLYHTTQGTSASSLQAYVKPPSGDNLAAGNKKQVRGPKESKASSKQESQSAAETSDGRNLQRGSHGNSTKTTAPQPQASRRNSRKKKSEKVVSLAEAAKGSIVFQQGKPCSCQARRHRLISNCLSCGKIVCEQEGEGPCNFCGALVLKEGSSYAGLDEGPVPISEAEEAAEAYAKRLVEYDRNSAARTTVIDDQSDYYEIEGNSWLSKEEKELLRKKEEEIEEAERDKRNRVVMTFDLVGRKVLLNKDEATKELHNGILFKPSEEKEATRIKPNPNLKVQPVFVDPGPRKTSKENNNKKGFRNGLCLEITGRVQHDTSEHSRLIVEGKQHGSSNSRSWHERSVNQTVGTSDDSECSLDYY
ncbi:activating signal cointegrator 1 [Capsicum galapagoense]